MKFYNSIGPNPRVVKMFMAEKGIDIPRRRGGPDGRREPPGAATSPGTPPARCRPWSSTTAWSSPRSLPICEYLEEIHPTRR